MYYWAFGALFGMYVSRVGEQRLIEILSILTSLYVIGYFLTGLYPAKAQEE